MKKKEIIRKVNKRRVKDYQRDAKYYDWYYIVYKNEEIGLNLNGWTEYGDILTDEKGKYIEIGYQQKEGKNLILLK